MGNDAVDEGSSPLWTKMKQRRVRRACSGLRMQKSNLSHGTGCRSETKVLFLNSQVLE